MAKTQSLAATIAITPAISVALSNAQSAFERRQQIDIAVRRTAEQREEAARELERATDELVDLEKRHALAEAKDAVDPSQKAEAPQIKKLVDKARDAVEAARTEIDRCERIRPALYAEANAADEAIAAARAELKRCAAELGRDLESVFAEQVRASIAQLAKAVSQARAVGAGLPDGFMRYLVDAMKIVDPAAARVIHTADGPLIDGANLLILPADDVDVKAITITLQPIVDMEMKFRLHRKFVPPTSSPLDAPYQIKGSTVAGRVASQPAPDYTPPPSKWQGRSWSPGERNADGVTTTSAEINARAGEIDIGRSLTQAAESREY